MTETDAQMTMRLRAETSAKVMDCAVALKATGGDYDAAKAELIKRGLGRTNRPAWKVVKL